MLKQNKQPNKNFNLPYKARLHVQKGEGVKNNNLINHQNTNKQFVKHMASRGKAMHNTIMRSPTDTNMDEIEDKMVIKSSHTKRTQETKKGSSSSKRKKNTELSTGLKDTSKDFWLGIVAMEKLAIDEGFKPKDCRPSMKKKYPIEMGIATL